jgi:GNAT superfamily N-acetyltransferase
MISLRVYEMDVILRNELLLSTARRLTLYSTSGMNIALNRYQAEGTGRSLKAKGLFAYKGEVAVGWCLLTQEGDGMDFSPADGFACVQIYVDPDYRRQGIGATLLKEATALAHGHIIKCYHWSNPSFFNPFIQQGNFQSL